VFSYARNIYDSNGKRIAIICLDVLLDRIYEFSVASNNSGTATWILLDNNLNIVAHRIPELLGTPLRKVDSEIASLTDELDKVGAIESRRVKDHTGQMKVVSVMLLKNGWYLGVSVDLDEYYANLRNVMWFIIILGLILATGLSIVLTHIAARKEGAENLQREADKRAHLMLHSSPLGVNFFDENLNCHDCNEVALKMFGQPDKEKYLRDFHSYSPEIQPCGERSAVLGLKHLEDAFEKGSLQFEWVHLNSDGETFPCKVTAVRSMYKNEPILICHMQDLRELKTAIAEINKARDAAEAASKAKTVFLANMSHEIRTPMNSIIGFAELAQDYDIPAKTKQYLANIEESAKWLLQTINDVLDISKIESGRMELEQIPFDLHDIFTHCQSGIITKAAEKGVALYCYAEPSIGKKLIGDPVKLRQILINLLSNAVKFTNIGTVKLLASITKMGKDCITIHFEVKDSGIGMSPEQVKRIFEPFIQADESVSRRYGGTGLGLTISKNFIEMMGGQLEVDSMLGVGSRFSFELKFNMIDAPITEETEKTIFSNIQKPTFKGNVLICEDNYMNRLMICDHLDKVGLKTVVAQNGKEGVDIVAERINAEENPFDLIFMDIHMPIMDGLEAAAKISALGVKTPIVALTANIMVNDLDLYVKSGMSGHLGKPFTSQELWKCLMNHLSAISLSPVDKGKKIKDDETMQNQLKFYFARDNQKTFDKIQNALDKNDIKQARRLTHSIKSGAGLIGEKTLQAAAAVAEGMLLGETNLLAQEHLSALKAELESVLLKLKPMLAETKAPDKILSEKETRDLLLRLESMLRNHNPECIHLVSELRAIPGTEELAQQIERFKFKKALAALAKIKDIFIESIGAE
ncbi:MAG: ATP-binding protein, partial [Fibromonadales bacterium]|nr:ATP-binding protein [Fibromonadales bacterium]